jgi:hypothetical protein
MMIAWHIDYHGTGNAPVTIKWEETRWVMESLGYSEFLYRFCLSGTSLLTYCELTRHRSIESLKVGMLPGILDSFDNDTRNPGENLKG